MTDRKIPGLVILPAGAIPPNPTELMLNGRLDVLMAKLNEDFDYILIDSPPIGLVTDAKIINKYVNACLYMVRHKYTPKYYLNLIDHLYSNKELTNISIVFNGLKMRGVLGGYRQGYGSGYGYGYGYGAGYGYGYTNDEKTKQSFALKVSGVFKRSK
jgi:Mrp family chromosome partitioning ATPase